MRSMQESGQPLLSDSHSGLSSLQPFSPAIGSKSGFWSRASLPLGSYCCCQVAYHGVFTSLVLYLKRVRNEDNAIAAATTSAVLGSGFCTSFFAAFLSDGFLGRRWTSVLILALFFLGCLFLSIITQLQRNAPIFFTSSIYLAGLGYGWFKPGLAALGGDQFDLPKDRNTFYNYLFVAGTVGEIFSLTLVTYLENRGNWAAGYWICTGAIGIGILCLLGLNGVKYCARENPFKRIGHVLVCATRKCTVEVPTNPDSLFSSQEETYCLLAHTDRFRFLDKAATPSHGDMHCLQDVSRWRLCSIQEVEEVKSLFNILPIWAVLLCKGVATSQLTSLFIEQGDIMNVTVGSFDIAPVSMSLFNMLARIFIAAFVDFRTRHTSTSTDTSSIAFMQIAIAYVAAILTMLTAAVVETVRLAKAHSGLQLSILWLVPQYAFEGITLVCAVVGESDFFYSAAAPGVRSLSSSLPVLSRGLGSYISSLLVTTVTSITTANGKAGWIASDLNDGHLNYFYLLLAIITTMAFVSFLAIVRGFSFPVLIKRP